MMRLVRNRRTVEKTNTSKGQKDKILTSQDMKNGEQARALSPKFVCSLRFGLAFTHDCVICNALMKIWKFRVTAMFDLWCNREMHTILTFVFWLELNDDPMALKACSNHSPLSFLNSVSPETSLQYCVYVLLGITFAVQYSLISWVMTKSATETLEKSIKLIELLLPLNVNRFEPSVFWWRERRWSHIREQTLLTCECLKFD